jgi:hypothetical protein
MIGLCAEVNATYGNGVGSSNSTRTVRSSTATTSATPANRSVNEQPEPSAMQYSHENTTSAEVSGVPSDHTTPSLRVQVTDIRSSATPPFSTVGISVASLGTSEVS